MLSQYESYLFDLDGTVYNGEKPIDSAISFITKLNQQGIPYGFITNNSTKTPEQVADKLRKFGLYVETNQIVTSALATALYVKKKIKKARVFIVGEEGLETAFSTFVKDETQPDAVIVGLDRHITYEKMSQAARLVKEGALFIATNPDRMLPSSNGLVCGNGAIVAAISYAAQKEPVTIGKPNKEIITMALEQLQFRKDKTILVGDNYETDIRTGIDAGMSTLHVKTGVTLDCSTYENQPTFSISSLDRWQLEEV
ncbi:MULTISPECIES: TIGR01457 family HAD-type hydrolase [Shouchella]|uniref:TIGR01457 family HAD-type hydrolase n=2 Tax=Shouchella TaxID=2893057 RepID=A0ABY7WCG1_9BACI|nr:MULTISPECIES: TIGR01457 family HAD-type hydrolase [Shouchella]MED4130309.1 TIGR01457 family HAD-type hydrolase [Shouchella miscanthi]WDF04350.1 TIGR01457 family HAD-type hydrolase [Shouchella hunanensis]